jgi:Dyp-type peroxidase family
MSGLDLPDIQGLVLFAYASLRHARYLHVSFRDPEARPNAWLAELRSEVHGALRPTRHHDERVHVALTHPGLARLGLAEGELTTFPRELQQGMSDCLRARVLGDEGASDPSAWEMGGPRTPPLHALLLLFAKTEEGADALRDRLAARVAAHGGEVVHEDRAQIHAPMREPFGFRDGISQPHVAGSPRSPRSHESEVAAGEFILGYPNAYGEVPPSPQGLDGFDLGANGSYLVYRKLRQDTAEFWQCMLDRASPRGEPQAATRLASRIVGRWPSGAPLVRYPERDPGASGTSEDFAFAAEDPLGHACPLGAHIRRANPRDMLPPAPAESLTAVSRHRLLRRGRPYGPPPEATPIASANEKAAERGLVFVALNTSLRRQFEFVQQTWLNNPKFASLDDERDPLVGNAPDGQSFTLQGTPARRRVTGLSTFVTVRGGGYFFIPGLRALAWLARRG